MKTFARIFFLMSLTYGSSVFAGSVVEDFSSVSQNNTGNSTAVWNAARGVLHVPHVVDRGDNGGEDDTMTIGNGTDGPFNNSTYASFDTDAPSSPNTITLDSTRTYNFTTFTLDAGYTVTGTSANNPLTIRVQGDVQISGSIDLNGQNGSQVSLTLTATPAGGTACCGGGAGGAGGQASTASSGSNGISGDTPDTDNGKGLGGVVSSTGVATQGGGGGGGGGHSNYTALTNDGETPAGGGAGGKGGGNAGNYDTAFISSLYGGSGGAGGGSFDVSAGAGTQSSGAGGGGGGGVLDLQAGGNILISSGATVRASGGNGGSGDGLASHAGAGGGGSGGSIRVFAGGSVTNDITVVALGGSGGTGGNGGNGGAGSAGRIRFEDGDGGGNVGAGSENPAFPSAYGKVYYLTSASRIIESKSYDTGSDSNVFVSLIPEESGTGTFTYEIAGSSDNFVGDDTGFLPQASISSLDGKRYVKFRVTLQSTDRTQSPQVSKITINYFSFSESIRMSLTSCGSVLPHRPKKPTWFLSFLIYCVLLVGLTKLRRRQLT